MIHLHSTLKEIEYHIEQYSTLYINEDDSKSFEYLASLRSVLQNNNLQKFILDELNNQSWLDETSILLAEVDSKILKFKKLADYIQNCKQFLAYKILQEKCSIFDFFELFFDSNSNQWFFYYYYQEKYLEFKHQKFLNIFNQSNISNNLLEAEFIEIYCPCEKPLNLDSVQFNYDWLIKNKKLFFNEQFLQFSMKSF
jgi:hypothetical protein